MRLYAANIEAHRTLSPEPAEIGHGWASARRFRFGLSVQAPSASVMAVNLLATGLLSAYPTYYARDAFTGL